MYLANISVCRRSLYETDVLHASVARVPGKSPHVGINSIQCSGGSRLSFDGVDAALGLLELEPLIFQTSTAPKQARRPLHAPSPLAC